MAARILRTTSKSTDMGPRARRSRRRAITSRQEPAMHTPGRAAESVNLGEVLENSPIGPLQIRVFVLCMLCLIMDGFDVQALGYAAPPVLREWGLPNSALGPVFA